MAGLLTDQLRLMADAYPDEVAYCNVESGDRVTFADWDAESNRLARGLRARGVGKGDRVGIYLEPDQILDWIITYSAVHKAGAISVPTNNRLSPGEVKTIYEHAEVTAVVTTGRYADTVGPLIRRLASLRLVIRVGDRPLPGSVGLAEAKDPDAAEIQVPLDLDDLADLMYTSGTTGRPKGVPLTHRQLVTSIRSAMAAWRWSADDVLVHALPLYHQHGLGGVHATLIAGATGHVRSKFTPADLIETARATRASVLLAVPAMYQALLVAATGAADREPDAATRPGTSAPPSASVPPDAAPHGSGVLSGLRLAVCGSAPLSPALAERLPAVLGQLPLVRYGTTETGLDVSNIYGQPAAGTLGVPLPGVLARIGSEGAELAAGEDGEIQLRGPQVFGGYWRDPAATAAAFTPDGWFRTGDIGRVDPADGQLAIRGRIKEMIITGGLNVYPREVELVLEDHLSVAEAAVAGVPHERWGEQVTAWVVMRPGHDFDERALIAHARAALAAYKCPKQVFKLRALPRNHLGKVLRSALTPR